MRRCCAAFLLPTNHANDVKSIETESLSLYLSNAVNPACSKWRSPVAASTIPSSLIVTNEIQSVSDHSLSACCRYNARPRSKSAGASDTIFTRESADSESRKAAARPRYGGFEAELAYSNSIALVVTKSPRYCRAKRTHLA